MSWRVTVFPFTAGYSFNVPLSDSATFYLGGKIGLHYYKQELSGGGEKVSESDSSGTYSALIGFKFAVAEKTDIVIGYEITKYWSDVDPYHFITVGFSWSF